MQRCYKTFKSELEKVFGIIDYRWAHDDGNQFLIFIIRIFPGVRPGGGQKD